MLTEEQTNQDQNMQEEAAPVIDNTFENELDVALGDGGEPEVSKEEDLSKGATDSEDTEGLAGWESDGRYDKVWGKDPNKLYGSYKELEAKLENNGKSFAEIQESKVALEEQLKQYSSVADYLTTLSKHEVYGPKMEEFFSNVTKELRREAYGADLPEDVIAKLEKIDSMEAKLSEKEKLEAVSKEETTINLKLEGIDKMAKEKGIEYDKAEFLKHCLDNNIDSAHMEQEFIYKSLDQIVKSVKSSAEEKVIANLKKNGSGALFGGTKVDHKAGSGAASLDEELDAIFNT